MSDVSPFPTVMQLRNIVREATAALQQVMGTNWWLEITTAQPHCTYYFGPFRNAAEAEAAQPGYIEDLRNEGATEIKVILKQCRNPGVKTICHEEAGSVS